ncbi:MAG TPA: hypothetical protein VFI18_06630 [Gaiellales bacterium]|nr:hypothetical protein [Gaiellales bacterium]
MGRLAVIIAGCIALLGFAVPAAADTTPPEAPEVEALTYLTQGVDRVMAIGPSGSHLSGEWRISNSPAVDADGMLVDGVTSTATWYDWDVTDPATGGNGVDGPHDIWVQVRDTAGTWGAVGGTEVVLDRTAPVVIGAPAKFSSGWAIDPPGIAVGWDVSAVDANCYGDCGGEAQVSRDGTTWNPFGVFAGGGTYQVRARETDSAGNTSDWTAVAPVTASERQESSEQVAWTGRWSQHESDTAYAGGYRSTARGGSTLRTTIAASNIEVVGTAIEGGGSMRVYLDGVLKGTVSERGVGEIALLRANFGKISSHTITLVAVASTGHRATFDAILALRQP